MKTWTSTLLSICCCCAFIASPVARADDTSFEQRLLDGVISPDKKFLTFTIENDAFGNGTDQNYTSGLRATWFEVGAEPPRFVRLLDRYLPGFEIEGTTAVYYSFGQNLYTPEEIDAPVPDPADRPYAAFLYASAGFSNIRGNHIDDIELTVGVVGPWALGEQTQSVVHEIVDATEPQGWDHQLDNEPGLIFSWQRRWPEAVALDAGALHLRVIPHAGVSLGNVYTYGAGGLTLQLTPTVCRWQSQPLRVRPAIPGTGFFDVADNETAWALFLGAEGRAVARNIFLDGNTFSDSPSVEKETLIADLNAGISVTRGRLQVAYTLNWRSKEFEGQRDESLFGAISFGYRF